MIKRVQLEKKNGMERWKMKHGKRISCQNNDKLSFNASWNSTSPINRERPINSIMNPAPSRSSLKKNFNGSEITYIRRKNMLGRMKKLVLPGMTGHQALRGSSRDYTQWDYYPCLSCIRRYHTSFTCTNCTSCNYFVNHHQPCTSI